MSYKSKYTGPQIDDIFDSVTNKLKICIRDGAATAHTKNIPDRYLIKIKKLR